MSARWRQPMPWLLLLWVLMPGISPAHETPIALLELRETGPGVFVAHWTYSSSRNLQPPTAIYPAHCNVEALRVDCGETGLVGTLRVERLGVSYSAVVVRITRVDTEEQSFTLTGAQPSLNLSATGVLPWTQVAASYVPLGIEHILLGIDHLMFVFGLMLLVQGTRQLITTITAFTIAHSLTLAAATFGWIGVPEASVNAAIALSIVVVAVEVLRERHGIPSITGRFPWAVAFGFGLLHGFGFATALTDIGLPAANLPSALLFFNIGVEIGQVAFVLVVLALAWSHRRLQAELPRWSETAGVYVMGSVAALWFVSRTFAIAFPPGVA